MGKRSIAVEYTPKRVKHGEGMYEYRPVLDRIISWTNQNGSMSWKEIKCPQESFDSIKGYYQTLGLPVVFLNRATNVWSNSPPN